MSEIYKGTTFEGSMGECITHHHACDCRETKFKKLEEKCAALETETCILVLDLVKLEVKIAELESEIDKLEFELRLGGEA